MEDTEVKEGVKQGPGDMERLVIESDLIKAYLLNLGRTVFLIAALIGTYYFVLYVLGQNPFIDMLNTLGIPVMWVSYGAIAVLALFFIGVIFSTLSLTSYELVFEGDRLMYSYGSFFKISRTTDASNIVRVNYDEYEPFSTGDFLVEFTGTHEKSLKVRYVSDVKYKCDLVNKLVSLKRSEKEAEIRENGVDV